MMKHHIPLILLELEPESYHLLVEVLIHEQFKGFAIIDTGASKTVFDEKAIKPFVKNIEPVTQSVSSGINAMLDECFTASISVFEIDAFRIEAFNTVIMNLEHLNQLYQKLANKPICGLIGSDFLVKYKAVIDYKGHSLLLEL